jgi:O-antigen/teichoic acid export membrane protein
LQLDWQFLQYFFKESWPLGLVTVLGMINFKIGPILLSLSKPMTDVGIYGSAYRVFENLVIIPVIFVDLIFPKLSELFLKNHHQFKNFFQKTFDVLLIMVFPVVIFFLFLAPYWIYIIAGKEFITASYPLKILIVTLFFTFLSYPLIQLLVAAGFQKWLIWATGFFVGPTIILNLILVPGYSYNGTAWVTLITTFINFLFLLGLTRYLLKIRPNFGLIKKLILPSFLMIFFLYLILSTSFFSLEKFGQISLSKQLFLVIFAFIGAGGLYSLVLLGLGIVPLNFLKGLIFQKKADHHPWPF